MFMKLTVVVVSVEVFFADQQIVVFVKLPEFAVNDVEVFIGKVVFYQVDVLFLVKRVED